MRKKYDLVERITSGKKSDVIDVTEDGTTETSVKGTFVVFRNNDDPFSYIYKVNYWVYLKQAVILAITAPLLIIAVSFFNAFLESTEVYVPMSAWVLIALFIFLVIATYCWVAVSKSKKVYKVPFMDPKQVVANYGMYSDITVRTPGL